MVGTVLLVLALGVWAIWASGMVPAWYHPFEPGSRPGLAQEVEDKLIGLQNWAASLHAWETANSQGNRPLAKKPEDELTICFTQDEVNAFLGKWYGFYGYQKIDGQQLSDVFLKPMVVLDSGQITIAGTVPPLSNRVVSLNIMPIVQDGGLQLKLMGVHSGKLPLPEFTWSKPRAMLVNGLASIIARYRSSAGLDKGGAANTDAVSVILAQQGIDILTGKVTQNVLFLPVVSEKSGLPVRLKSVDVSDGMLTLTTEPLTADARQRMIHHIREGIPGDTR